MSENMNTADQGQNFMNEVLQPEFQNWVKGIFSQDIARKTLCEVFERKWKTYISELTEEKIEHIEIFMKCLDKNEITNFKAEIKTLRCGHNVCESLLTCLLELRNFSPDPPDTENFQTTKDEIHKTHEANKDKPIEKAETEAVPNLQKIFSSDSLVFYWPFAKLYASEEYVSRSSLKELDTVNVIELLDRCTLFSFSGSQKAFKEICHNRNVWLHSSSNKASKGDTDALLQCFVNLLKNFEDPNFYQCSDAVADLQQLINTDLCSEYERTEYMHLVKMTLEMKVTALSFDISIGRNADAENICLNALLKETNNLLQLVEEMITEAETDEVTALKSENESLKSEVKRLQSETQLLKSQTKNTAKDVSNLELENRTLTEKYEQLKKELDLHKHIGCPGKPEATEVELESVTLTWDQSSDLRDTDYYQIHYKEETDCEWSIHPEKHRSTTAVLADLKPGATYIFRIKTVRETENVYSPESDAIVTLQSQAAHLVEEAGKLEDFSFAIYLLPLTKVMQNGGTKIVKYHVDAENKQERRCRNDREWPFEFKVDNQDQDEQDSELTSCKTQSILSTIERMDEGQLNPSDKLIYSRGKTKEWRNRKPLVFPLHFRADDQEQQDVELETTFYKTQGILSSTESSSNAETKTIIIFGAKGSGRIAVVDGIMNYALGVRWNDYFRFTVKNKYMTALEEWITCYILNPKIGNRLTYQLQVIVIPGFSDASCAENENVIRQIRQLFVEMSEKDDPCIAAICLVVEATGGVWRTAQQRYTLQLILSLFGKDIRTNVCTFLVSADNKYSVDSVALEESKLPLGNVFYLNQFHHFARCMALPSAVLLKKYWSVLVTTISEFFAFVEQVAPCTLQLTLTILNERISVMEINRNLQTEIESVSTQAQGLQADVRQKQEYEHEMKRYENYEYEVTEMEVITEALPAGKKDVTSCPTCSYTCHDNCSVPENKEECWAMGKNGFCKNCPNKCHWSLHTNTSYVFKNIEVQRKKTDHQMRRKYFSAESRFSSQKTTVDASKKCLRSDLTRLNAKITNFKRIIQTKNENALQQDPQSEFINTADRYHSSNWTGSNTQTLKKFEEIKKLSEDVCDEKEIGENPIRFRGMTTDDTMKEGACSVS